jgi:hypothetical protein
MKSDAWAEAVLVGAIAAPLAAIVITRAIARRDDRRWFVVGSAVGAAGWLLLLLAGEHPTLGRLAADDFALAAGAGTCILAIGISASENLPLVAAAVSAVTAGVAVGTAAGPSTVAPLIGVALAAGLLVARPGPHVVTASVFAAGLVLAGVGLHTGDHRGAVLVLAGVTAIAVAGALVPRDALVVLVPAALVLGLRVAPALDAGSVSRWTAVGLGVAGVALAAVRRPWWCAALIPWTLAAGAGALPGTAGAGPALAAGAVLALALGGQAAVLAAVPGAALFTYALVDGDGWVRPALAVLLGATVVGLSMAQSASDGEAQAWRWIDSVPAVAGAWLVLRPTSWTFLRVDDLSAYVEGTAFAIAAGLIGGVAAIASGRFTVTELRPLFVRSTVEPSEAGAVEPGVEIAPVLLVVVTGIIAAALVRSARL